MFNLKNDNAMHDNVKISVKVNAPIEKVWDAITNREQMKEWYFNIPDFELKEHAAFNFFEGEDKKLHHHCEIVEIIPQKKLKHSWTYPDYTHDKTLVKWELQPESNGTLVTLTHKGLENFDHLGADFKKEKFQNGWDEILNKALKNFVEN